MTSMHPMPRLITIVAALFYLVGACATADASGQTSKPAPREAVQDSGKNETPSTHGQTGVAEETDADAIATASRIEKEVEEIRGLKFKQPVKKGIYDKERLAKFIKKSNEEEKADVQYKWQQSVFKAFGMVPESMDLLKETEEVLMEQIGGFYDPKERELRVMRGFKGFVGDVLMAHELCHALDDQYFSLQSVDDANKASAPDNDDRVFAAHAVMEGCATDLMNKFAMRQMTSGKVKMDEIMGSDVLGNPALSGKRAMQAPKIITTPLMEMYMSGASFLARGGGMMAQSRIEDVEHAFLNPPLSSEQVLHPKKYWEKDKLDLPTEVTIPDLSKTIGSGWKRLGSNVLGEIGIAVMTLPPDADDGKDDDMLAAARKMLNRKKTTKESQGWDGDRYDLYENGDGVQLLVWVSVYDSPKDAGDMAAWIGSNLTVSPSRQLSRLVRTPDDKLYYYAVRVPGGGAVPQSLLARLDAVQEEAAKTVRFTEAKPWQRTIGKGSDTSGQGGGASGGGENK